MGSLISHRKDGRIAGPKDFTALKPILDALDIGIINASAGQAVCPGLVGHTKPNKNTDCVLWINKINGRHVPRLSCFHTSCHEIVDAVNEFFERAIASTSSKLPWPTYPSPVHYSGKKGAPASPSAVPSRAAVRTVLAKYPWKYRDIQKDSPVLIDKSPKVHHIYVFSLFANEDVIWIGRDLYDSGSKGHRYRFQEVEDWESKGWCPGSFICPATFQTGVCSRSDVNVAERKFLVVESDDLTRDQVGSVFMMLQQEKGLVLRAVVDTAGKSLHGWFHMPPVAQLPKLKHLLSTLMCDPKMFGASQPCRLPGAVRGGKYQTLIYFNENP